MGITLPLFIKGKVRDVYDLGNELLIVASDRISAFDFVIPTLIPDKGKILNQISVYWFNQTQKIVKNHFISSQMSQYPEKARAYKNQLEGRSMLVHKTNKIPIECVVRGYLSGSGWKEYNERGSVCGISLPKGMKESEKLPEPIFTPATKEEEGKHDLNITFEEMSGMVGKKLSEKLKELSISIFNFAAKIVEKRGLILADTKFEFGLKKYGKGTEILLIDECLTPDSSRFWQKEQYRVGMSPPSFDKQFVRNYLDSSGWDRSPPAPPLPDKVVEKTRRIYLQAYQKITGDISV